MIQAQLHPMGADRPHRMQQSGRTRGDHMRSVVPERGDPTEGVAVNGNPADGWERQVRGNQHLAVCGQLGQQTDPDTGRLLGVMFEAVVPIGVIKADGEHGVTGKRQPFTTG